LIPRRIEAVVQERLSHLPAVGLLGPRQVGKTTLAQTIGATRESIYLDLESPIDREKLSDPVFYLSQHVDKLIILDEVQRMPELFAALRGLIDADRRRGKVAGRFLLVAPLRPICCGNLKRSPEGLPISNSLRWMCSKSQMAAIPICGCAVVFQKASWLARSSAAW